MGNLYKNESKPTHSANMFAIFSEGVNTKFSDSNKIIKKINKKANETGSIVVKPADHSQVLSRPKVCSLQNAIEVNIDGKLFCLAHLGQRKHKDALQLCHSLNATLPLPTSITEHNHFTESFKRLGINERINDFSTKIVLDVQRLSNKDRVILAFYFQVFDLYSTIYTV